MSEQKEVLAAMAGWVETIEANSVIGRAKVNRARKHPSLGAGFRAGQDQADSFYDELLTVMGVTDSATARAFALGVMYSVSAEVTGGSPTPPTTLVGRALYRWPLQKEES